MFDSYYPFRKTRCEYPEGEHFEKLHMFTFRGYKNERYIVLVEQYPLDIFALKFYLHKHRYSKKKYQLLSGLHDAPRIIRTCIEIFLHFLKENGEASLGFVGSNLVDENMQETKRYRIYSRVMQNFFSPFKFEHRFFPEKSVYLILNKSKDMDMLTQEAVKILDFYRFI